MVRAGVFATVGGLAAAAVLAAAPAASAETVAFGPNSQAQPFHRWTVPAKVCSVTFDLFGAEGSGGVGGARVTTTLAVTPGTPYFVFVGSWGVIGTGGYNGGGDASGNGVGGGGATDVRTGPSLAERILVAGGGGGNGGGYMQIPTGGGGGASGLVGSNGDQGGPVYVGWGGFGGTASSGGNGGSGASGGTAGTPGTLGQGGEGGSFPAGESSYGYGGGGGGGLYGGGGGGAGSIGSGGGGGSSLAAGGTVTTTSGGQGKAIITYTASPTCGEAGGGGGPGGGGGGQPGGGADRTKPRLRGLTFSRHSFTAARSGASTSADTKRTPKTGTKVSFSLSETGKVVFTVERKLRGRKRRGRCVEPSRSPSGKPCTRWVAVKGSFSFAASAGKNTFIFRGRVGGTSLKPGDYRLNSKATDIAHNASSVKRAGFTIAR